MMHFFPISSLRDRLNGGRIFRLVCLSAAFFLGLIPMSADPMIELLETQIKAADESGVTGPEVEQLRKMLRALKEDAAATRAYEIERQRIEQAAMQQQHAETRDAHQEAWDSTPDDATELHYTTRDGEPKMLRIDPSQRAEYAGYYANEYRDPALADFRYTLNADGTAVLEYRACENCTHELDGSPTPTDWQVHYTALSWAPVVAESGEPMERNIKDLYDNPHRARVLIVALAEGGVMSLNHYKSGERSALDGPFGVPRLRQE